MGMCNLNVNFKPYSAVMRMSDDFFPDKEDSFREHILQNIYTSVFLSELFYCDFDMWWSKHISAKQNMILRMISGGPIYISDKIGESDIENIKNLLDKSGKQLQCDSVPRICETDLFHNPCEGILRVENTPVSYTHLDVYKRQVKGFSDITEKWKCLLVGESIAKDFVNVTVSDKVVACLLYTSRCV